MTHLTSIRAALFALAAALLFGTAFAQVSFAPPADLAEEGTITYCATIDNPPRAFFTPEGEPQGFEIDLGVEIANRLGLDVQWEQMAFDGIIPSLLAERCDAIVQELFIREARLETIDMIPFAYSAQSIVINAGSDLDITGPEDLSGLSVAVPNGTTIFQILSDLNEELTANGQEPINLVILETTTDTFQQLSANQVDAVGTTNTAAAYYVGLAEGDFEFAGDTFGRILDGIGFRKEAPVLQVAMSAALSSIMLDGTYDELLAKWNLEGAGLLGTPGN